MGKRGKEKATGVAKFLPDQQSPVNLGMTSAVEAASHRTGMLNQRADQCGCCHFPPPPNRTSLVRG
ncbi:hypothetical protein V6Z12_D12G298300 [Gossypium hirsutum]